jgi:hypothetical protein
MTTTHQPGWTLNPTPCTPWCTREDEHDNCAYEAGRADDTTVQLVRSALWEAPKIMLSRGDTIVPRAIVLLPLDEGPDMAELMIRLGHKELGELVLSAVRTAK